MHSYLSPLVLSLVRSLLNPDPALRITASDALAHPWLTCSEEDLLAAMPIENSQCRFTCKVNEIVGVAREVEQQKYFVSDKAADDSLDTFLDSTTDLQLLVSTFPPTERGALASEWEIQDSTERSLLNPSPLHSAGVVHSPLKVVGNAGSGDLRLAPLKFLPVTDAKTETLDHSCSSVKESHFTIN